MYEWRKNETKKNWLKNTEIVQCLHCETSFRRLKDGNKYRDGQIQLFCSNECNRSSDYKKQKLRDWGYSDKNHFNKKEIQEKKEQTKFERYGNENYNNPIQQSKSVMERYGVPYSFWIGKKSNGIRISKGQRLLYEETRKEYPDAILEHWLLDVQRSVDIFIPSQRKIIEYYGDYWHCNPIKYQSDYYHTVIKKTAKEIWERDKKREQELIDAGYQVTIKWENH